MIHICNKGLVSKTYKEPSTLNYKKTTLRKIMSERSEQTLHQRTYVDANKQMKKKTCKTSFITREIQI